MLPKRSSDGHSRQTRTPHFPLPVPGIRVHTLHATLGLCVTGRNDAECANCLYFSSVITGYGELLRQVTGRVCWTLSTVQLRFFARAGLFSAPSMMLMAEVVDIPPIIVQCCDVVCSNPRPHPLKPPPSCCAPEIPCGNWEGIANTSPCCAIQ